MKVEITKDVDGMRAGEVHDLRGGYASALVYQGKAKAANVTYGVDPGARDDASVEVAVPAEPVVETRTDEPEEIPEPHIEVSEPDDTQED